VSFLTGMSAIGAHLRNVLPEVPSTRQPFTAASFRAALPLQGNCMRRVYGHTEAAAVLDCTSFDVSSHVTLSAPGIRLFSGVRCTVVSVSANADNFKC
jgi:hypothetical protein